MDKRFEMILLDIYFVPVVTYLIFSTGDYAGRILSGIFQWVRNLYLNLQSCIALFLCEMFLLIVLSLQPKGNPWLVMFMSVARGVFIPVLMFCNAQPRHHLPVYIHNDIYYILITIMFAVTNGYLCNLIFILVPT